MSSVLRNNAKWHNLDATEQRLKLTAMLGKPDVYAHKKGGVAIWNNSLLGKKIYGMPMCFKEIWVRDESVSHIYPSPHRDNTYAAVAIDIHPKVLPMVLNLSGSVTYDPIKKYLIARCSSLAVCIVTLKLATDIVRGVRRISKIKKFGTYGKFISMTYSAENKDEVNHKFTAKMYQSLCRNLKEHARISSPLSVGYWTGAVPKGFKPKKEGYMPVYYTKYLNTKSP